MTWVFYLKPSNSFSKEDKIIRIMSLKQRVKNFLIWSQKYTQTDMVYLAKGGFWLTLGKIISAFSSLLLAIAFANLLDPVTYGNYKYILSLVGILGVFSLTGMGTAITQAVARSLEGSFQKGFRSKLKWGTLGSLVALGGAIYYFSRGNYTLPIPLLISAAFLPLMQASKIYEGFLAGKKLFNFQVKYSTLSQIISVGALIGTLFLTKNLFWLIAVYFVSRTLLNYSFYLITRRKFQPNKKEDSKTLSYGKHLSLIGVISAIGGHLDKILLFTLVGSGTLAVYSFAIIVPDQVRGLLKSIKTLALPKFAGRTEKEIKRNIMKKVWKLSLLAGVIIVAYIMIAPSLYKIFFPKYLSSIPYSQFAILALVGFPFSLITVSFKAKMRKKELYLLNLVSVAKIALVIILVPFFGIWGAVIAIVGTKIFRVGLELVLFRKF